MVNYPVIPLSIFGIAVILLIIRLYQGEKNWFLASSGAILLGSIWTYFSLEFSTLLYFAGAMLFSVIGDLLMAEKFQLSQNRIVDGSFSFGIAHVLYIVGFLNLLNISLSLSDWWLIPVWLIITGLGYYYLAYDPRFHIAFQIAILIYTGLIVGMFISVLIFVSTEFVAPLAVISSLIGAILFIVSDGVLAYNEFKQPLPNAKDVIAVTYILGQILLQLTPIFTLQVV